MSNEKTVTVPETLLQDLLWNIELGTMGTEPTSACDRAMREQAEKLQRIITPADYVDPNEGFTLEGFSNVYYADFSAGR